YRLPRPQGRSASGSSPPAPQDVGSGRDLFKKFMLMRGMFQQPPSDNVIVISQPSTTTTTTTTPITTTTPSTTTTTTTTNGTTRALNHNLGRQLKEIAVPTFTGLEDRLDLPVAVEESPEAQDLQLETVKHRKQSQIQLQPLFGQKKFKLRSLPAKNKKKNVHRNQKIHHRRRFIQKKHRHQHQKKQKTKQPSANQHRSSESVVDFIEPYHNERSPSQTSQSGSESQLQRIWRRFQLAN
ncbi:hypothetical protein KR067_004274, partial [Drosophila pandora]